MKKFTVKELYYLKTLIFNNKSAAHLDDYYIMRSRNLSRCFGKFIIPYTIRCLYSVNIYILSSDNNRTNERPNTNQATCACKEGYITNTLADLNNMREINNLYP